MELVLIEKVAAETTVAETASEVTPLLKIIVETTAKDTAAKNSSMAGTTEMEMTRTGTTAMKKVAHKQLSTKKVTPEDLAMDIPASEKVLAESIVMKGIPTDNKTATEKVTVTEKKEKRPKLPPQPPSFLLGQHQLASPLYAVSTTRFTIHLIRQYTFKKEVRSGVRSFVGI